MHLTARTPLALFALATVVQAGGAVVASADTTATVEKITLAEPEIIHATAQTQCSCRRTTPAEGTTILYAVAESVGEGTNHTYVDLTRLVGRAWVRGQWEIAGYSQMQAGCEIEQLRPVVKISPVRGAGVAGATGAGGAVKTVAAKGALQGGALPFGESDTYYGGARRVADASAQFTLSTAAVSNTVAFSYAVDLVRARAEVEGDAVAVRRAGGAGIAATSATGWMQHWFPVRGVAVLKAIASGTAQLTRRIARSPTVIFSAAAEGTGREARIGTTGRRIEARATTAGISQKIRVASAEAFVGAAAVANGRADYSAQASVLVTAEMVGGIGVNMGKPAPDARTMRIVREEREMVIERSPRLMKVA